MRPVYALFAFALLVGACGDDDSDSDDGPGIELDTDATQPAPPSTETTVTTGDSEPAPADDPASSLELNPPKTSVVPPTTTGEPIGRDESLYPGQFDPGLDLFVEQAVADLAVQLDVDPGEITPVSATLVTWSDSSLGCPQPGMVYAQVLEDGSLIELEHGGRIYSYHTGGTRITPFLCNQAVPPLTGGGADI